MLLNQAQALNMRPGYVPTVVHVSQGDVNSVLQFYLYNGSEIYVAYGTSVTIHGVRADGVGFGPYDVQTFPDTNMVSVNVQEAMTAVPGAALAELTVADGDMVVGSANFAILVEKATFPGGVTYANDTSVYQSILDYVTANVGRIGALANMVTAIADGIETETAERTAADETMSGQIETLTWDSTQYANDISALQAADGVMSGQITALQNADTAMNERITEIQAAVGSPLTAATVSAMTDTSKIYVYTGSESGMTAGNWYYHNGTQWVSGGVYNSVAIETDTTLSVSGKAADAKVAGDAVKDINSRLRKTVTVSNYASLLPDLNNAPHGSFYVLNFGATGNKPANLPDSNIAYSMAMLITLGDTPYREQYLLNEGDLYSRVYATSSGTWQAWSKREFLLNGVKNAMVGIVTVSNYAAVLPNCDNAPVNSVMILNFAASGNKPTNVPDANAEYPMSMLLTYGSQSLPYKVQYCIDKTVMWQRIYNGNTWGTWSRSETQTYIIANPSNLIATLKQYNDSGADILLENGDYDVYQMYIDYYGSDFWSNYEGYNGVADPFYKGVYVQNANLIGNGNAVFRFSGTTTNAIKQYFSLIAPAGRVKIDSIMMDVGTQKLRYAVHDDVDPTNNKWGVNIEYHNIVFRGTPDSNGLIGAGFRNGGNYKIDNCVFLENNNPYDISYHSHLIGSVPSKITISNCYGEKACSFAYYGSGTEPNTCIVNNCEFGEISKRAISGATIDNMNLIKFRCTEHTD